MGVTPLLETFARVRTMYGENFYVKVIDIRLDGMNISKISRALLHPAFGLGED